MQTLALVCAAARIYETLTSYVRAGVYAPHVLRTPYSVLLPGSLEASMHMPEGRRKTFLFLRPAHEAGLWGPFPAPKPASLARPTGAIARASHNLC